MRSILNVSVIVLNTNPPQKYDPLRSRRGRRPLRKNLTKGMTKGSPSSPSFVHHYAGNKRRGFGQRNTFKIHERSIILHLGITRSTPPTFSHFLDFRRVGIQRTFENSFKYPQKSAHAAGFSKNFDFASPTVTLRIEKPPFSPIYRISKGGYPQTF